MEFKKDTTGKLQKALDYMINKERPDLKCLNFLCVWREKDKYSDGKVVQAEVQKLSNKHRDVFGYDVILEVSLNSWKDMSKEEKKKLIFHELEHVQVEYENDESEESPDSEERSSEEILEAFLDDEIPAGNPKRDKEDRVIFYIVPHNISLERFSRELIHFGLSTEEEGLRQFLNYVYEKKGLTDA